MSAPNPILLLDRLLEGVQATAPDTGKTAMQLREAIEQLQRDLALLTPVCVPTTGEAPKMQRTLERVDLRFLEEDERFIMFWSPTNRMTGVSLRKGMTQDHVIYALADLCIEIAK